MTISLTMLWPYLAAACAALSAFYFARALHRPGGQAARALANYAGAGPEAADPAPVGSRAHRVRLAFGSLGARVAGRETAAVWTARLVLGGACALALRLSGFPPLAMLGGAAAGWLGVDMFVAWAWRRQQFAIERELPAFLSALAITLQVVPNAQQAVADVAETLDEGGPLRAWLGELAARVQAEGRGAYEALQAEAQTLSPALGLVAYQLQRLSGTGGAGYGEAFAQAAEGLGQVLEARAVAAAKAGSARGLTWIVLGSMLFTLAVLARTPEFQGALHLPVIQLVYLALAAVVAFGLKVMNDIVDEAMA